jgi:hypothetical protein
MELGSILLLLIIAGCSDSPRPQQTGDCVAEGRFKTELYGAFDTVIDWQPEQLECQGMPRPNGAGARLRFAGPAGSAPDAAPIAVIMGIPDLEQGKTAKELPTNVTVIDEQHGRFFATLDTDACWSDIDRQQPGTGSRSDVDEFVIGGILYCMSPLAELHGNASLQFSEISFVGRVNWRKPE